MQFYHNSTLYNQDTEVYSLYEDKTNNKFYNEINSIQKIQIQEIKINYRTKNISYIIHEKRVRKTQLSIEKVKEYVDAIKNFPFMTDVYSQNSNIYFTKIKKIVTYEKNNSINIDSYTSRIGEKLRNKMKIIDNLVRQNMITKIIVD